MASDAVVSMEHWGASMGILQQADEERARRKDNPDDWPQIKARLFRAGEARNQPGVKFVELSEQCAADIRAALERIEERETTECREILHLRQRDEHQTRAAMLREIDCANLEAERNDLRQRVEELETHWKDFMQWDESAIMFDYKKRAEAAENKLARCVEALLEIKGRALASQTHEIGPLEAKERLAAVLVSARAALAAAKGE